MATKEEVKEAVKEAIDEEVASKTEEYRGRAIKAMKKYHGSGGDSGPVGFVLFIAWIGALVYFVQQTSGFWNIILAILKSFVWPAFVLYEVLKNLGVS